LHQLTQRNLGHLQFDHENWAGAHAAYSSAIEAGSDLLAQAYTEAGLQAEVGETARLFASDAFSLLQIGCLSEALLVVEHGRTRLLNKALQLGEAALAALPAAEQAQLRAARQAVRDLERELEAALPSHSVGRAANAENARDVVEALCRKRADLDRLIAEIRMAGCDFMPTGLSLPELLELIPRAGAMVAPFFTAKGGAAFVLPYGAVTVTEAHVLMLDQVTDASIRSLLAEWMSAYRTQGTDDQSWFGAIEQAGRAIWDRVLGPVHERLRALGIEEGASVILLPQGGLGECCRCMPPGERRKALGGVILLTITQSFTRPAAMPSRQASRDWPRLTGSGGPCLPYSTRRGTLSSRSLRVRQ
jgi:hypothetical protein